jgi:hypothetical protein
VQSGSKGDHFDLNLLADVAVMLSCIADVIESEIHRCGVIDVDLYREPMWPRTIGGGGHLGVSIDLCGSAALRGTAGLGAQHQGESHGGHAGDDDE